MDSQLISDLVQYMYEQIIYSKNDDKKSIATIIEEFGRSSQNAAWKSVNNNNVNKSNDKNDSNNKNDIYRRDLIDHCVVRITAKILEEMTSLEHSLSLDNNDNSNDNKKKNKENVNKKNKGAHYE